MRKIILAICLLSVFALPCVLASCSTVGGEDSGSKPNRSLYFAPTSDAGSESDAASDGGAGDDSTSYAGSEGSESLSESGSDSDSSGAGVASSSEKPHEHSFTQEVVDEKYCVTPSTFYESGEYYYSCECGAAGSDTFFAPLESPDYALIEAYIDNFVTSGVKSGKPYPVWNTEKGPSNPTWNYMDGCMLISFLKLYALTGEEKYYNIVKTYADYFVKSDGSISTYSASAKNLDNINEGRILFDLYEKTGDEKYRRAIDTIYKQFGLQGRNNYGSFEHKSTYPHQVWLDGLYMAEIFYTRYLTLAGEAYDDVMLQFDNVERFMKDEVTGLYYHGFHDGDKKTLPYVREWAVWSETPDPETGLNTGLSPSFWLRSIGWYITALSDMTEYLPQESEEREKICGYLRGAIDSILEFEDEEGHMFYQVVDKGDKKGNYLETSGSALVAYSILHGVNTGALDESYWNAGKRIFNGIYNNKLSVGANGEPVLTSICKTAGLGNGRNGSFEYYVSEAQADNEAKGVAPFIMAYIELLKREAKIID